MSLPSTPPGSAYAVIQMDPVAVVSHLDARALEEAQELRPKKYLILTSFGISFSFPGYPWSVYDVLPAGPSLRAIGEKRGLEPDMCVPIFPNEAHPTGRAPVRPTSLFPYDNCYHWASMKMELRIHAREEGFETTEAIRLGGRDMVDMTSLFSSDRGRGKRALLARQQAAPATSDASSVQGSALPPTTEQPNDTTAPGEVDVFGPPTKDPKDPEFIPLVHLWLDLPANLRQEHIQVGDPVNLYKEGFAITKRAHERNPELLTLREHIALHHDPCTSDSDSDSYISRTDSEFASEGDASEREDDYVGKPKRFRPAKLLRKLRSSVRGVFCLPF